MVQRVCILGATGSVGGSTLDVIALHPERYQVFALTAQHRMQELASLCQRWRPRYAVVATAAQANALGHDLAAAGLRTEVLHGDRALCEMASHPEVDSVMAAIVAPVSASISTPVFAWVSARQLMKTAVEPSAAGGWFSTVILQSSSGSG